MIFEDIAAYRSAGFSPQVCIIGSGPAGISLALKLEQKSIPCLILEAGDYSFNPIVQEAYQGEVIGDPYFALAGARLRYFGGSSGHWAGMCRGFDDVDFEPRPGLKHSGWPIRKKDLDPYRQETESILEIEAFKPDEPMNADLRKVFFQYSKPVRFGDKYRKHIQESKTIVLLFNSPLVDINPVNGRIDHVKVNTRDGTPAEIKAPMYCLCTGGIENSRLLLWTNELHNGGVVPHAQTLGKYWMEHPIYGAGEAVLSNPFGMRSNEHDQMTHIAPSREFLHKTGCGNFGLRMFSGGNFKALIKTGLCIAPEYFTKLAQKVDHNVACAVVFRMCWEQIPVSTNRIELDKEKDATGVARPILYWKKQPEDRRTAELAVQTLGAYLAKEDRGRVRAVEWLAQGLDYPEDDEKAGFHHMGGTRMAAEPSQGIVDKDCKVFGVENLYVGGSSVFTTGGFTNPTYPIVQLALRLGDHLEQKLARV